MPASALREALRLAPTNRVLDLEPRLPWRDGCARGRLSCQLGGPGIRPLSSAPEGALLRSLYRALMFMDLEQGPILEAAGDVQAEHRPDQLGVNHVPPEVPAMYVALVNTLV